MSMLTRDEILNADDLDVLKVKTPEWGSGDPDAHIYIRIPRAAERDRFEAAMLVQNRDGSSSVKLDGHRAKFCILVCCDDQGKSIFTQADIDRLGAKSSLVLDRIMDVGKKFTGIGATDEGEDAKNFSETKEGQSDDSGTN